MVARIEHAETSNGHRTAYLAMLILGGFLVFLHWGHYPPDFAALYFAGQFFAEGTPASIYPKGETFFWDVPPHEWQLKADAASQFYDRPARIVTPYIYPPIWVLPLSWLSKVLDFKQASHAMLLLNVASLLAMLRIVFDLIQPRRITLFHWVLILTLLLVTSTISRLALHLGQPQVLVSLLTLLAFVDLVKNRPVRAGAWLALAASIKLAPALFVVIFLMERNWKALGSFTVFGSVLAGLSVMLMGWPIHEAFLTKLSQVEGQVLVSRLNLSLELALFQIDQLIRGEFVFSIYEPDTFPKPIWVTWATRLLLVFGVVLIAFQTRIEDLRCRIWARLLLVAILLLLTSPLGWLHYMILPLVLLPGLIELARAPLVATLIAVTGIGYSLPLYLRLTDHAETFLLQSFLYTTISLLIFWTVVAALRPLRGEAA